jgi:hypothetical protein
MSPVFLGERPRPTKRRHASYDPAREPTSGGQGMKRSVRVGMLVLAFGAATGTAQAERVATPAETQAVAAAMHLPASCSIVRISTVDSRFAYFTGRTGGGCAELGNGFEILRRSGSAWKPATGGSDLVACSKSAFGDDVPLKVLADLKACRPARGVRLDCNDDHGHDVPQRAPVNCVILPGKASLSGGIDLHAMQWRNWGRATATGTGYTTGFHVGTHIDVRITLTDVHPPSCATPVNFYRTVKIRDRFGTFTLRNDTC